MQLRAGWMVVMLGVVITVAATGQAVTGMAAGLHRRVVSHQDMDRTYVLYVPQEVVRPAPLIVLLHGGGGTGEGFLNASGIVGVADKEGFVVAAPDGVRGLWNAGACCGGPTVDDVGFIAAMLGAIESEMPVDRRRIFATGHSNGGFMCYRLACELSDRIAAIAPCAGYLLDRDPGTRDRPLSPPEPVFECAPKRPVAVLHAHGLADTCAPFTGGPVTCGGPKLRPPVSYGIDAFRAFDRCSGEARESYRKGAARCLSFGPCADGSDVVLCTVEGGGHTWFGNPARSSPERFGGGFSDDLDMNQMVWEFFKAHPMVASQ